MSNVLAWKERRPEAVEVSVTMPQHVDKELFREGFEHGMKSNQLTNFKASYRAGFREAKLYIRQLRREQGIVDLPMKAQLTTVTR